MLTSVAVLVFAATCLAIVGLSILLSPARSGPNGAEQALMLPGLNPSHFTSKWERMAQRAGLAWKGQTYYQVIGTAAGVALLSGLMGHMELALGIIFVGVVGPYIYLHHRQAVRSAQFSQQLPQALFLAASVLRAGGTLLQAVDSIATEMPDPLGGEFRRIQRQLRLQVPVHQAMAEVMTRLEVPEFSAVVVASRITSEVGGNLAHVFDQIARSIIDGQNAQRTVQAFTTEGRMSATVVAALPFVVMGLFYLISPGYFDPFLHTAVGRITMFTCLGTILLGYRVVLRMVTIRLM